MGMDVYGKDPSSEEGKYFRNNVWWWHPLATYCLEVVPTIAKKCTTWHSNDGGGLNKSDSLALAIALQHQIDTGECRRYALRYQSRLAALPKVQCWLCEGTGTRLPTPNRGKGDPKLGHPKCNACDGEGFTPANETLYPFDCNNVREFVTFLLGCGGFEIN